MAGDTVKDTAGAAHAALIRAKVLAKGLQYDGAIKRWRFNGAIVDRATMKYYREVLRDWTEFAGDKMPARNWD